MANKYTILSSQNTTSPGQNQSVQHLSCPQSVRILLLISLSCQYSISPAHSQSEYHSSYPYHVSTASLLPIVSQNTTPHILIMSGHHLSYLFPLSSLALPVMCSQYTMHLSCPCISQSFTYLIQVQFIHHPYCSCHNSTFPAHLQSVQYDAQRDHPGW